MCRARHVRVHAYVNEMEEMDDRPLAHLRYQQEISRLKKKLQVTDRQTID
jgi:hypothetical protein